MNYVEKNAEERKVPSILTFNDGTPVNTAEDFELRREEIKILLQEHEYGYIPKKPDHLEVKEVGYDGSLTIEREISGEQQRKDIIETKAYLETLI